MKIFDPLYDLVSWIILTLHTGFDKIGMSPSWSWCLAIVGLVVMIRIALIPLFVKQIRSMRAMQQLQPEIKKIQQRYKGDRERTSQELMKLYKHHNTNPLASCLPVLAQAPFFFALFQVLNQIAKGKEIGVLGQGDVDNARQAFFFTAPLHEKFLGAELTSVKVVALLMIIAMSASQFYTQRQLMTKNMSAASMEASPFMQQQKIMMYLFPILFGVFGINFPVGVLLYWLVSNLWSMGQQMFVIRRMPAIGSPAYDAMVKRREGKGDPAAAVTSGNSKSDDSSDSVRLTKKPKAAGSKNGAAPSSNGAKSPTSGTRQQPKSQPRSKRAGSKKR